MKLSAKALAIVLLFVGLVLVNYLASSLPARLDLTADSIYSLSTGTKTMLGKIEEPVVIDLYFSKDAPDAASSPSTSLRHAPIPRTRRKPPPPVSLRKFLNRAASNSSSASSSPKLTNRKISPPSHRSANSSSNTISRNSSTASSRSTSRSSVSSRASRSRAPARRKCK